MWLFSCEYCLWLGLKVSVVFYYAETKHESTAKKLGQNLHYSTDSIFYDLPPEIISITFKINNKSLVFETVIKSAGLPIASMV